MVAVEAGMTIRVLDNATYEEYLAIDRPGVRLRGLHFETGPGRHALVYITGLCPGVILHQLDMTSNGDGDCVAVFDVPLSGKDSPIVIQNCTMREGKHGLIVDGKVRTKADLPQPCGHVVFRHNTVHKCNQAGIKAWRNR
jgi:hypothetical protein